jgi:hypothetical protein
MYRRYFALAVNFFGSHLGVMGSSCSIPWASTPQLCNPSNSRAATLTFGHSLRTVPAAQSAWPGRLLQRVQSVLWCVLSGWRAGQPGFALVFDDQERRQRRRRRVDAAWARPGQDIRRSALSPDVYTNSNYVCAGNHWVSVLSGSVLTLPSRDSNGAVSANTYDIVFDFIDEPVGSPTNARLPRCRPAGRPRSSSWSNPHRSSPASARSPPKAP